MQHIHTTLKHHMKQLKILRQLLEIDDQMPNVYYYIGSHYNRLYQYDKAIPEFEKSLEIYNKWDIKPLWASDYTCSWTCIS